VVKSPKETGRETAPQQFPEVPPPRDLYAMSDIRFVMTEVGKLTANVDRLIADVKTQGEKLNAIQHQASFIKGGIAVSVILIGVFIAISSFFLSARWDAAIQALRAIAK
jgi:hypothetical protein